MALYQLVQLMQSVLTALEQWSTKVLRLAVTRVNAKSIIEIFDFNKTS